MSILKNRIITVFLLCIFVLSTFMYLNYIINPKQNKNSMVIKNTQEDIRVSIDYQLVDPINISFWSDRAQYPFITGEGTELNPFIIEKIEIRGDGVKTMQSGNQTLLNFSYVGIFIDTNGSVIIRNCKISQTSIGIHLSMGIPPGEQPYQILNVEITDCSIGIYSAYNPLLIVNISNCFISNSHWVSITAPIVLHDPYGYGGIGIWFRHGLLGSTIEDCLIVDCSIGMIAGNVEDIYNNKFINCGIVLRVLPNDISSNTVNGKPIGLFLNINNLVFTQANASQYGQLIFLHCDNLTLSNIHITEPSSIGIQIYSFDPTHKTYLNNIIIENQIIGMYITGYNMIGENLYAKNCKAGFFFSEGRNSNFTKIMTDNTDVPVYAVVGGFLENFTIEIEQSTKFCLVVHSAMYGNELTVKSSNMSYNLPISYISELGCLGFVIQFHNIDTYRINISLPWSNRPVVNFTIISVPRYTRPAVSSNNIPGYPLFWVYSVIVLGISIYIELYRRKHRM